MPDDVLPPRRACTPIGALALTLFLVACGGGGGGSDAAPPPIAPSPAPAPSAPAPLSLPAPAAGSDTRLVIASSPGDSLGGGSRAEYTLANAGITLQVVGSTLYVTLRGDEFWKAEIRTSPSEAAVVEGLHTGLRQRRFGEESQVGMNWLREGNGCETADAMLSVDRVRYANGALAELDLRIAHRCTGDRGMLQAQVRWVAGEIPVRAAAPAVPATLWRPAAGTVPSSGNVVVVESSGDERVFEGRHRVFTEDDALMIVTAAADRVEMNLIGGDSWRARLRGIDRPEGLQPGYHENLRGVVAGYNPARGGLEWDRFPDNCAAPRGWFAIDRLRFERGALTAIEFRFEQRCLGRDGVVRGLVRWDAGARRLAPAPGPAPVETWSPPAGSVPAEGNHLLLASVPGDPVGEGQTRLFSDANSLFRVHDDAGVLYYVVTDRASGRTLRGDFQGRGTVSRLEAGYRAPMGREWNPVIGGLRVEGPGGGCTLQVADGWFMVDEVSHRHGVLREVALRFEQRCADSGAPLRGSLRWRSDDPSLWSGPADAPLPEPVIPPAPTLPDTGSAALFESRGREYLGFGEDWLYTRDNAVLSVMPSPGGSGLFFSVRGDESWSGFITPPAGQERLQVGRFAIDGGTSFPPSGRHILSLGVDSRGCGDARGWVDILDVAYSGSEPSRLEFRFELYCDTVVYPLLGHFRWRSGDEPAQPVPPQPVPAGLWAPPAGALPAGRSALYVQSNPGGFVGAGQTFLLQPEPGDVTLIDEVGRLDFTFRSPESAVFSVDLRLPPGELQLRPGFYEGTRGQVTHPLRLAVSLRGGGRGCSRTTGWAVVDDVAYDELGLQRIALRLQQYCDGAGPPAMAALQWIRPPR